LLSARKLIAQIGAMFILRRAIYCRQLELIFTAETSISIYFSKGGDLSHKCGVAAAGLVTNVLSTGPA
jgi:hypothetical protein